MLYVLLCVLIHLPSCLLLSLDLSISLFFSIIVSAMSIHILRCLFTSIDVQHVQVIYIWFEGWHWKLGIEILTLSAGCFQKSYFRLSLLS